MIGKRRWLGLLVVAGAWLPTVSRPLAAVTMGTAFTYQGRFTDAGSPAEGPYDFEFILFDAATGGTQQGSAVHSDDVDVDDGYFTVAMDFGGSAFAGDARWLQIAIRPGAESGSYTTLTPRHRITPGPYALFAERTAGIGTSGGNVGVGTSSPSEKLHVSGGTVRVDSTAVPMILRDTDTSLPDGLYRIVLDGGQFRIDRNMAAAGDFTSMTSPFYVKQDGSVHFDGGSVGINAYAPQYKLHVRDASPALGMFEGTGSAAVIALFDSTTTAGGQNALVRMGDNLTLRTLDYERVIVKSNGDVGIGVWTPQAKLDVDGNVRCVDVVETSDEQLKTDVEPLGGVLDKLDRVRAVSFRWNEKARAVGAKSGPREFGVLAQEVEQVFPELVSTPEPVTVDQLLRDYPEEMLTPQIRQQLQESAERSQYKAVSYSKLTVVLLEAVKELKSENESLETTNASLEQRIRALESKIQ